VARGMGEVVARAGPGSGPVTVSIRPELISIFGRGDGNGGVGSSAGVPWEAGFVAAGGRTGVNRLIGTVVEDTFLGQSSEHVVAVGDRQLNVVSAPPRQGLAGQVALEFDPTDVVVLGR